MRDSVLELRTERVSVRGSSPSAPLLAKPLPSHYWTPSVSEDEAALGRFIQASPRRDAMQELPKVLTGFQDALDVAGEGCTAAIGTTRSPRVSLVRQLRPVSRAQKTGDLMTFDSVEASEVVANA